MGAAQPAVASLAADDDEGAGVGQEPAQLADRAEAGDVEDDVVAGAVVEVLAGVVDDAGGAEGADQVGLRRRWPRR